MKGTVYLVGAGPGAPDLLTLRAARVIERADVLFHDALVHPEVIALARHARVIAVGKRCGKHSTAQRFINKQLVDAAARHAVVVRLKGGDPMLFGRAEEEIAALEAHCVAYEIVPGVTAASAACAQVGVSLTVRGKARSVALVTPRVGEGEQPNAWVAALGHTDCAAIYMGVGQARDIAAALIGAGRSPRTPVVVVENAMSPEARAFAGDLASLPRIAEVELAGPALILLGPQFAHARGVVPLDALALGVAASG